MNRLLHLLCACMASVGCRTAPVRAIPDPLPEVLEWLRPAQVDGAAYLGLKVRENGSGGLEALTFDAGVRVTSVAEGSPAALAGFVVGDVLLAWGEVPLADPESLDAMLGTADPDVVPTLHVRRSDSVFELQVPLQAPAASMDAGSEPAQLAWRIDPSRSRAGWLAGPAGVALVTSDPNGPFAAAGIEPGSVVTELDGVPYRSERSLIRALQARAPGETVVVRYRPPGSRTTDEAQTARVDLFGPGSRVIDASLPILAGYSASADGVEANFYLIDLWLISLFKYRRDGSERHWSILRFLRFSTGVGELSE
ncbi:MAG: hypothetical protein ACI8QZ_001411 [Chlamydiales bacterium]|jgi:hypothetical protein